MAGASLTEQLNDSLHIRHYPRFDSDVLFERHCVLLRARAYARLVKGGGGGIRGKQGLGE